MRHNPIPEPDGSSAPDLRPELPRRVSARARPRAITDVPVELVARAASAIADWATAEHRPAGIDRRFAPWSGDPGRAAGFRWTYSLN